MVRYRVDCKGLEDQYAPRFGTLVEEIQFSCSVKYFNRKKFYRKWHDCLPYTGGYFCVYSCFLDLSNPKLTLRLSFFHGGILHFWDTKIKNPFAKVVENVTEDGKEIRIIEIQGCQIVFEIPNTVEVTEESDQFKY